MHGIETIAAISTPPGSGGIGVVRVSGPDALTITQRVFVRPNGQPLHTPRSHRVYYGYIINADGERVDEVLFCLMQQPHSYTREDVVEISCHGGVMTTQGVLDAVLAQGARAAEPGEFTRRAFMNGRLDLAQAEAVIDLINARTLASHRAALHQLDGALSRYLRQVREELLQVSVYLEAGIDFPEDDIELLSSGGLVMRLEAIATQCRRLLQTFGRGRLMREGLATAIIGRPNVGKSSLLNCLLGRDRAIVSAQPGTTRDTIEAELDLEGLLLRIIDTAGIRVTADTVEQEGVRRAREVIGRAECLIVVLDGSTALTSDDHLVLAETVGRPRLLVRNKGDLEMVWSPQDLHTHDGESLLTLSARHDQGLAELETMIVRLAVGQEALNQDEAVLTRARHHQCLGIALKDIDAAADGLRQGLPLEFVAFEVTEAMRQVSEVLGESCTGDVLDRIFSSFCIGK